MTNETIQIYYYPVASVLGVETYHETAVYTNSEGQTFYSLATDTIPNKSLNLSAAGTAYNMVLAGIEANNNDPSIWGTLEAKTNVSFSLTDTNKDSPTTSIGVTQAGSNSQYQSVMVASGADLSSQWATMNSTLNSISSDGLTYSPATQNSNSAMTSALQAAGITPPNSTGIFGGN